MVKKALFYLAKHIIVYCFVKPKILAYVTTSLDTANIVNNSTMKRINVNLSTSLSFSPPVLREKVIKNLSKRNWLKKFWKAFYVREIFACVIRFFNG